MSNIKAVRDLLNSFLAKQIVGLITFEDLKTKLLEAFPLRQFSVIRYGQKQPLDDSLENQLEELSEFCEVDIALAAEFSSEDSVLIASIGRNVMSNCFPFMLSNIAANILLLTGTELIPGCYRLICYNTAQHVKKKHQPKISMSSKTACPIANIKNSILSTVNFVEEHVTTKFMESGALRLEIYCKYEPKSLKMLVIKIRDFMVNQVSVLKEQKTSVVQFLQYMGSILATLCDNKSTNFSDYYLILHLYSLYINAVFSAKRLTKDYRAYNIGFGIRKELFDLPYCQLNIQQLYLMDWPLIFSQFESMEKKPSLQPFLWILLLKEVSNSFIRNTSSQGCIDIAIDNLFKHFEKKLEKYDSLCRSTFRELSFDELIVKASMSSLKPIEKEFYKTLVDISGIDKVIYEQLKKKLQQQAVILKIGGNVYICQDDEHQCSLESIQNILKNNNLSQSLIKYVKFLGGDSTFIEMSILQSLFDSLHAECKEYLAKLNFTVAAKIDLEAYFRILYTAIHITEGFGSPMRLFLLELKNFIDLKFFVRLTFLYWHTLKTHKTKKTTVPTRVAKLRDNYSKKLKQLGWDYSSSALMSFTGLFECSVGNGRTDLSRKLKITERQDLFPTVMIAVDDSIHFITAEERKMKRKHFTAKICIENHNRPTECVETLKKQSLMAVENDHESESQDLFDCELNYSDDIFSFVDFSGTAVNQIAQENVTIDQQQEQCKSEISESLSKDSEEALDIIETPISLECEVNTVNSENLTGKSKRSSFFDQLRRKPHLKDIIDKFEELEIEVDDLQVMSPDDLRQLILDITGLSRIYAKTIQALISKTIAEFPVAKQS